jgi:hypothetical protein
VKHLVCTNDMFEIRHRWCEGEVAT